MISFMINHKLLLYDKLYVTPNRQRTLAIYLGSVFRLGSSIQENLRWENCFFEGYYAQS